MVFLALAHSRNPFIITVFAAMFLMVLTDETWHLIEEPEIPE